MIQASSEKAEKDGTPPYLCALLVESSKLLSIQFN